LSPWEARNRGGEKGREEKKESGVESFSEQQEE
jgi:hypothetical protein